MKLVKNLSVVFAVALSLQVAQANKGRGYIGGLGGWNQSLDDGAEGILQYGANVGFNLAPKVVIGGYFTYNLQTVLGSDVTTMGYGGEINYYLAQGLYLGGKAGVLNNSDSGVSGSNLAYGGQLGYDHMLGAISVGVMGEFLLINSTPSSQAWAGYGSIKYWF